jgi:DNA processing protein
MSFQAALGKSPDAGTEQFHDWRYGNIVLWYQGDVNLLASRMASIVGTRQPSEEGIRRAKKLTNVLVQQKFTVVSGLAAGVDAAAHKQALAAGGKTIAVMGTPIDECYPAEHHELKQSIAENGLVLSQFPAGSKIFPSNFPQRNILMAALSSVTFVVEADAKSGTRHQVNAAIRIGRCVGFLASLVDRNIPWVTEALDSGSGFIVENTGDVIHLLGRAVPAHAKDDIESQGERDASLAHWASLIEIDQLGKTALTCDRITQPDLFKKQVDQPVPATPLAYLDSDRTPEKGGHHSIIVSLFLRLFRD